MKVVDEIKELLEGLQERKTELDRQDAELAEKRKAYDEKKANFDAKYQNIGDNPFKQEERNSEEQALTPEGEELSSLEEQAKSQRETLDTDFKAFVDESKKKINEEKRTIRGKMDQPAIEELQEERAKLEEKKAELDEFFGITGIEFIREQDEDLIQEREEELQNVNAGIADLDTQIAEYRTRDQMKEDWDKLNSIYDIFNNLHTMENKMNELAGILVNEELEADAPEKATPETPEEPETSKEEEHEEQSEPQEEAEVEQPEAQEKPGEPESREEDDEVADDSVEELMKIFNSREGQTPEAQGKAQQLDSTQPKAQAQVTKRQQNKPTGAQARQQQPEEKIELPGWGNRGRTDSRGTNRPSDKPQDGIKKITIGRKGIEILYNVDGKYSITENIPFKEMRKAKKKNFSALRESMKDLKMNWRKFDDPYICLAVSKMLKGDIGRNLIKKEAVKEFADTYCDRDDERRVGGLKLNDIIEYDLTGMEFKKPSNIIAHIVNRSEYKRIMKSSMEAAYNGIATSKRDEKKPGLLKRLFSREPEKLPASTTARTETEEQTTSTPPTATEKRTYVQPTISDEVKLTPEQLEEVRKVEEKISDKNPEQEATTDQQETDKKGEYKGDIFVERI